MLFVRRPWRERLRWHLATLLQGDSVYCPICARGYRLFLSAGVARRRPAVRCPGCQSLERHRLFWLTVRKLQEGNLFKFGGRLLHVAPEACLTSKLRELHDYLSIDLEGRRAMRAMDITKLAFADESFDVVICHHVLEHVKDDRAALSELHRVLRPGGWASIQVPIVGLVTDDDPSVSSPEERESRYGQRDHVRQYGADFIDRLRDAGFSASVYDKRGLIEPGLIRKTCVARQQDVILVSKKARSAEP